MLATLFLDTDLNIRFFTPATKLLFRIIPGDIGRPLADLNSLAADSDLLIDARTVLRTLTPIEREIEAQSGAFRTSVAYCLTVPRITGSRASSSHSPIPPSGDTRQMSCG